MFSEFVLLQKLSIHIEWEVQNRHFSVTAKKPVHAKKLQFGQIVFQVDRIPMNLKDKRQNMTEKRLQQTTEELYLLEVL